MNVNERLAPLQEFVRAFNAYGNGILPEAGAWNDQPATFTQAVGVLGSEMAEIERQMIDEVRKKQARKKQAR